VQDFTKYMQGLHAQIAQLQYGLESDVAYYGTYCKGDGSRWNLSTPVLAPSVRRDSVSLTGFKGDGFPQKAFDWEIIDILDAE
jgi:hypothetical protein